MVMRIAVMRFFFIEFLSQSDAVISMSMSLMPRKGAINPPRRKSAGCGAVTPRRSWPDTLRRAVQAGSAR